MNNEEMMEEMDLYYTTLEDRPDIGWFLQGHLVIEHLLKKRLLQKGFCTEKSLEKHGFYTVVNKCFEHGLIDDEQKSVLLLINNKRNSYAHDLAYSIPLHTSPGFAEFSGVAGTFDKDGNLLQAQP